MQTFPDNSIERAARKNAAALDLMRRGRLREALNTLNQAIALAPSYPQSYANRAAVFERMGLQPQADGDRRRAEQLAGAAGLPLEEPLPEPITSPRAGVSPPSQRSPPGVRSRQKPAWGLLFALAAILALILTTGAAGYGLLALLEDNGEGGTPSAEETPASPATEGQPATSATAPPETSLTGSPFSFSSLQKGWQAKGMTIVLGPVAEGFSGFTVTPYDSTLTRASGSAQLAVFVYDKRESAPQDWDLPTGSRPSAKSGRSLPAHETIWWNSNVVIVVRTTTGDISNDALDAVVNLAP